MHSRIRFSVVALGTAIVFCGILASSSLAGTLVVLNKSGASASLIDDATGKVIATVPTGNAPHEVAVSPDGRLAVGTNYGNREAPGSSLTVIDIPAAKAVKTVDLDNGKKLGNIVTGEGAEGIAVTPDGKHVWVTNRAADTICVIDTSTLKVVSTLESKTFPIRAKVTPDGRYVLVSNARSGDLGVFDAKTHKEIRRVSFKTQAKTTEGRLFGDQFGESSVPIGIVIRPDGKRAYVAHTNADQVSVIDLESWEVAAKWTPGEEPDGMDYSKLTVEK